MQLSQGRPDRGIFFQGQLIKPMISILPRRYTSVSFPGFCLFKPWERGWLHICSVTYTHNVMIQTVHITYYYYYYYYYFYLMIKSLFNTHEKELCTVLHLKGIKTKFVP